MASVAFCHQAATKTTGRKIKEKWKQTVFQPLADIYKNPTKRGNCDKISPLSGQCQCSRLSFSLSFLSV